MYSKRRTELIKAISELKETDYTKAPELNNIYQRLTAGRVQFEEALEKNINAIMQISALDLTLHHLTEEILEIRYTLWWLLRFFCSGKGKQPA